MSRIKRGWELTKKSWGLLRSHPELIRFPLYGAVATIVCALIVVGPGILLIVDDETAIGIALGAIGFYLLAVIGFYFSVGLAAAADMVFHGRADVTVADGLAVSRQRFSQVLGWAALATTVGLVLGALESQGTIGELVGRLLSIGWSLITFLAVPVIALEGTGPIETLKRSAVLFKARWGQQVTGNIAIGGAVALLGVLPSAILIAIGVSIYSSSGFLGALLVIVGAIGLAVALLISKALSGIFGVALYRYALDGEAVGGFTVADLESAVKTKGGGPGPAPTTI